MIISIDDKRWLSDNYPDLVFKNYSSKEILEGNFQFSASFDKSKKQYILNPSFKNKFKNKFIQDTYKIRIVLPDSTSSLPKVLEIDNRIKKISENLNLPLIDLHLYEDGSGCILGKLDEVTKFTLQEFITGPVLQYFFDISYFEIYKEWPRGTYSHGHLGIIENYYDKVLSRDNSLDERCIKSLKAYQSEWQIIKRILLRYEKPRGHWSCLCGSKKKLRTCHPNVFKGLWHLHTYYEKIKL